jgi:hypothetical protein
VPHQSTSLVLKQPPCSPRPDRRDPLGFRHAEVTRARPIGMVTSVPGATSAGAWRRSAHRGQGHALPGEGRRLRPGPPHEGRGHPDRGGAPRPCAAAPRLHGVPPRAKGAASGGEAAIDRPARSSGARARPRLLRRLRPDGHYPGPPRRLRRRARAGAWAPPWYPAGAQHDPERAQRAQQPVPAGRGVGTAHGEPGEPRDGQATPAKCRSGVSVA